MVNTLEIQQALQHALPDNRFTVNTRLHDDELIIVINRSKRSEIDYQFLTQAIEQQLTKWQLDGIKKLKCFGRIHYQNTPEWQKVFEVDANRNHKANLKILVNTDKIVGNMFARLPLKKSKVKVSSKLLTIKLALLGTFAATFVGGLHQIDKDEIAGFHLFSIAAVTATGLAVVEAIDVLYQEIRCRH